MECYWIPYWLCGSDIHIVTHLLQQEAIQQTSKRSQIQYIIVLLITLKVVT